MSEWLDGYIADSELVETIVETLESFDKEDDEACSHRISSLQYSLIRQMIGKWHNLSAEFPEMADSYSNECLGRIFNVCLYGNWSDWLRILKCYSPGLDHETSLIKAVKESSSITDAPSELNAFFNHLKVDFIKDSL